MCERFWGNRCLQHRQTRLATFPRATTLSSYSPTLTHQFGVISVVFKELAPNLLYYLEASVAKEKLDEVVVSLSMFYITVLLVSSLIASTTASDNVVRSTTTIQLPHFTFRMLLSEDVLNTYEFRSHVVHATNNHLAEFIQTALTPDFGEEAFQALHLESILRRNQDRYDSDPAAQVDISFQGSLTLLKEDETTAVVDQDAVHIFVAQALVGNAYWKLMHLFIEDELLEKVENLAIIMDDSVLSNPGDTILDESNDDKANRGMVGVLAFFSTIVFFASAFLLYLAYRRYSSSTDYCCSHSKGSDTTDQDDDIVDGFDDEEDQKTTTVSPPKRKKRRAKPNEKLVLGVPSLDSIIEESDDEQEGMSTVPLGVAPGTILI